MRPFESNRHDWQGERIALSDAMLIILAMAVELGSARWWYGLPGYVNQSELGVQAMSEMVGWFLLPMSPALIGLRFRTSYSSPAAARA